MKTNKQKKKNVLSHTGVVFSCANSSLVGDLLIPSNPLSFFDIFVIFLKVWYRNATEYVLKYMQRHSVMKWSHSWVTFVLRRWHFCLIGGHDMKSPEQQRSRRRLETHKGAVSWNWVTSSTCLVVFGRLKKIIITTLAYHRLFEMCIWKSPPGIICCHQQQGQNEPWNAAVKQHLSHDVQYTATAAYKTSVCPQRWLVFIRIRLDPEIKCPSLSTMTVLACSIKHKV